MDIFSRISWAFVRWTERKGPELMQFFPHAVAFLCLTAILCSLAVRIRGRSWLLFSSAVTVSFLLAGLVPSPKVWMLCPLPRAVFIAFCIFVVGVAPVCIGRMAGRGPLSRASIMLLLYLVLFCLFIINFIA